MRRFFVHILANYSRGLYVGVTNDLKRRVGEHKRRTRGFTSRYRLTQLVYFESFANSAAAKAREKQLKGWLRMRKVELIEKTNPMWLDLSDSWFR